MRVLRRGAGKGFGCILAAIALRQLADEVDARELLEVSAARVRETAQLVHEVRAREGPREVQQHVERRLEAEIRDERREPIGQPARAVDGLLDLALHVRPDARRDEAHLGRQQRALREAHLVGRAVDVHEGEIEAGQARGEELAVRDAAHERRRGRVHRERVRLRRRVGAAVAVGRAQQRREREREQRAQREGAAGSHCGLIDSGRCGLSLIQNPEIVRQH